MRLTALFLSFLLLRAPLSFCAPEVPQDPAASLYPSITKVDDGLYFARMASHPDLYLAMEKVNHENYDRWYRYAQLQGNPRIIGYVQSVSKASGKPISIGDGTVHFKSALESIDPKKNEMWIAYITRDARPQHIPPSMRLYKPKDIEQVNAPFAKDIQMFVTVTSSHDALLTSHIGVAASAESILSRQRTPGVSMDLHSFGAKVMQMRNPRRRYMINAPAPAMAIILLEALPKGVFIGTRQMREEMQTSLSLTLQDFEEKNPNLRETFLKAALSGDSQKMDHLNAQLAKMEDNSEKEKFVGSVSLKGSALEIGPNGLYYISQAKAQSLAQKELERRFSFEKNPYWMPEKSNPRGKQDSRAFLELMEKHPPILSVQYLEGRQEALTIYEPQRPTKVWLEVRRDDPAYNWLFFSEASYPSGTTCYCLTDLLELAPARRVERAGL